MYVTICSLVMQFLAAKQPLAYFGLGKGLSVKRIKADALFCKKATVFSQEGHVRIAMHERLMS